MMYNYSYYPNQIIKVSGESGARAFQMMPSSSALLLDETAPLVWLKQTDASGFPSLIAYKIEEYKPPTMPDINELLNRLDRLESKIYESNTKPSESEE